MKIAANGIDVHYDVAGQGSCVVLVHGFTDNRKMWFNQFPELSKRYRVLAYDVRGFGETRGGGRPYSMGLFAEDLRALLEAVGIERAFLLGYSMGGRIALEVALRCPEKVRGLVFANSGIGEPPGPEMQERRKIFVELLRQGDIDLISEMMAEASFSPGLKQRDPELFRKYKEIKKQNDPSDYLAIMEAIVSAIDAPVDLGRLRCPALIIAGDRDGFMALGTAEAMRKAIPGAELVVFPTGHAAALEAPAAFNAAVLKFLDGQPQQATS
ncbi:MAG: alpha/beta hydrolase [bacterium]